MRIAYRPVEGQPLPDLAPDATIDDGTWSFEVVEGFVTQFLADLTGWALRNGVALDALTVTRPSLEDTYLELIAHEADEVEVDHA